MISEDVSGRSRYFRVQIAGKQPSPVVAPQFLFNFHSGKQNVIRKKAEGNVARKIGLDQTQPIVWGC